MGYVVETPTLVRFLIRTTFIGVPFYSFSWSLYTVYRAVIDCQWGGRIISKPTDTLEATAPSVLGPLKQNSRR